MCVSRFLPILCLYSRPTPSLYHSVPLPLWRVVGQLTEIEKSQAWFTDTEQYALPAGSVLLHATASISSCLKGQQRAGFQQESGGRISSNAFYPEFWLKENMSSITNHWLDGQRLEKSNTEN